MSKSYYHHPVDIRLYHTACVAAFIDAGLFHRDISFGNIMIGLDGAGRLNDWDLCRGVDVDKSLEGPRTVSARSYRIVLVFTYAYRELGSSCLQGCS